MLDLIYPPLLPCCVSSLHSEATTPQPRPPSHSATQIVRDDPLSPPAEPFVPMSLRAICRGFGPDPAQLARSACPAIAFGEGGQPWLSAYRRIAPQRKDCFRSSNPGKVLRFTPDRARLLRSSSILFPSPWTEQLLTSFVTGLSIPPPPYSYVATQPNREDPSGKRLLLRPFPLSQ